MKQALLVDRAGPAAEFAATVLREGEYELTVVDSLQVALGLVSSAPYNLVMIAQPHLCPNVVWRMVDSIKRLSSEEALILVQGEAADKSFHARARKLGAAVLSLPLAVAARPVLEEVSIG